MINRFSLAKRTIYIENKIAQFKLSENNNTENLAESEVNVKLIKQAVAKEYCDLTVTR